MKIQQNANSIFGENKSLYYSKEELKDIQKDQEKRELLEQTYNLIGYNLAQALANGKITLSGECKTLNNLLQDLKEIES